MAKEFNGVVELQDSSNADNLDIASEGGPSLQPANQPSNGLPEPNTPNTEPVAETESDGLPSTVQAAVSHPMTASNSASSNPSALEGANETASPYGTRSRQRGGTSRPNYAEDRETETDTLAQSGEEQPRKTHRQANVQASAAQNQPAQASAGRRATQNDSNIPTHGISKADQIPGTSTFSANPAATSTAQQSKKRKAAGQPGQSTTASQAPSSGTVSAGQQASQRASPATQVMVGIRESCMLSFENCAGQLNEGQLTADDGTVLAVNDHVYLVCEPPGEPYYLGRIMEFLHVNNDLAKPVDALRMNWYYRPKDIGRKVTDTRQVFASMHSDISPLTSLRGVCQIRHKSEVQDMDEYRRVQNCFWYDRLYDRYVRRYYEVIPTSQVVNVPAKVKRVLDDRWKFILVESGRGKELTSAVKSCKRCSGYCASNDSVDCAVCRQTYHMNCVRPPLLKKPSRGFAWACGPCSRAQERMLEARNTPNLNDAGLPIEDEEYVDDEDDHHLSGVSNGTRATSPSDTGDLEIHPGTEEQIHHASLWQFRYLGVHCRVEDALDYDDRIYPRSSSRLGTRHQADVLPWPGRPFEYVKPIEMKRKYVKGGNKKDTKFSKDTVSQLEAEKSSKEKRAKWVVDEPQGYILRGEDYDNDDPRNTSTLLYKAQEVTSQSPKNEVDIEESDPYPRSIEEKNGLDYCQRAMDIAPTIGLQTFAVNFVDKALELYCSNNYDIETSLEQLSKVTKKDLKEPELSPAELKKFEDGVAKFGSELHSVKKHVKSVSAANIVRFYYIWKKTDRGKQVWGNFPGRKGKKEAKKNVEANTAIVKLQDDVADDHDDSAFDNDKAAEKKRGFQCKFCSTRSSRQWRRAPGTPAGTTVPADPSNKSTGKDKTQQLMVALCINCAVVWRKYAVQWDDSDDHKKNLVGGGRGNKRKADDHPNREFQLNELNYTAHSTDAATTPIGGTPIPQASGTSSAQEPVRKKAKNVADKDQIEPAPGESTPVVSKKKEKAMEKTAGPPPVPEMPKPKTLPCAVCFQMDPLGDEHITCKECRMAVHRNCYGIVGEIKDSSKWLCDMCTNDRSAQISVQYNCVLCPIDFTEQDFVEPPRVTHKKKSEKEREKDRIEREVATRAAEFYRKKQEEMNRPVNPREPLKRTANNNWVHVSCAVWTPEVKFANARALETSEGIPSIATARYDDVCKVCKTDNGACVACHTCRSPVHVECAHQNGYLLGFDIAPVKGSRRDQTNIVTIKNEAGAMTAVVWCKDHIPTKTIVHNMYDPVDDGTGRNVLQLYVQNFKQADLTLTGTVRKATLVNQSAKVVAPPASGSAAIPPNRRASLTMNPVVSRGSSGVVKIEDNSSDFGSLAISSTISSEPKCITCETIITPKWWPYPTEKELLAQDPALPQDTTQGGIDQPHQMALASAALNEKESKIDIHDAEVQCHKCHFKKVRKPQPIPPPAPKQPSPPPRPPPVIESPVSRPVASPPPPQSGPRYAWGRPAMYSPPVHHSPWPQQSPRAPIAIPVGHGGHQYNGTHSPRSSSMTHHMGSQQHPPPPSVPVPHSPHLNGLGHPINGYHHSPHRSVSGHPMQNAPIQNGPMHHGPMHNGPMRDPPLRDVPMQNGPMQNGPMRDTPMRDAPMRDGPMHSGPMRDAPVRDMRDGSMQNGPMRDTHMRDGPMQNGQPMQNGPMNGSPYVSYSSARMPPQHLTNGGPPPRAPENPFSNSGHAPMNHNHHTPFPSHASPPMHRDPMGMSRDSAGPNHNQRGPDGRVNGGASASPSLHNLLS